MALCEKCGAIVEGAFCIKCETPDGAADGSAPKVPHQLHATPQASTYRMRNRFWWILGGCLLDNAVDRLLQSGFKVRDFRQRVIDVPVQPLN